MDDFRVGSTSPLDAYRDREQSAARKRKAKPHTAEAAEDEYVSSSGEAEDAGEPAEDYYSPSEENKEAE